MIHVLVLAIAFVLIIILLWVLLWQFSLLLALVLGAPVVYTNHRALIDAFDFADLKPGKTLIDLGCGDGNTLILAAKKFKVKGIGVERSPYFYFYAKLKVYLSGEGKNIKIFYGDFRQIEKFLSQADFIYVYLLPNVLKKIENWLFTHIKDSAKIISMSFYFSEHQPFHFQKTINLGDKTKILLYRK